MNLLGIDEAHRSPVLGSLVIAGILIPDSDLQELKSLGVKDSKQIHPQALIRLDGLLRAKYKYKIIKITGAEISKSENLNELEAEKMSRLIGSMYDRGMDIFIDCVDVTVSLFRQRLNRYLPLKVDVGRIYTGHKFDEINIPVGAASILAKAAADRIINRIRKYHLIGSGQPNDKITLEFLRRSILERKHYDFVRENWITYKRILEELSVKWE